MWRTILLYGVSFAILIFLLKLIEYRFLVRDLSLEFYLGLVALLFTAVGVWTGKKITSKKFVTPPATTAPRKHNEGQVAKIGISKREYEVLLLMAKGLSNQEIADQLHVSLNTIKTHTSNLFLKLEVKRRTQAIQKAKDLELFG
ncbi:response regulator transcription factor [Chryseosolibacter indicus]|uniref:Response regulator transcription factor n=1 Tax=Chryseosolibacter indicus TaxID=2782351 RepID=A0ABS5VUB5_9BACT|nr:response regulator transcription factor [Chryseosolibacter indicus]MBT1704786.1 response regulator transcription factor [Chryseosolibacter indicus]